MRCDLVHIRDVIQRSFTIGKFYPFRIHGGVPILRDDQGRWRDTGLSLFSHWTSETVSETPGGPTS